jgi:Ca2+-transporting ATPase
MVLGDAVLLQPQSYLSADIRLIESHRLSLDESALTGESLLVEKQADAVLASDIPWAIGAT